jgi:FlaA1/EpsC-like NDP-sugar epimerase
MIRSLAAGSKHLCALILSNPTTGCAFPAHPACRFRFSNPLKGMFMNGFHIIVVGAGETGTPLLKQLLTAPFIKVLGVADLDPNQPGMVLARQFNVPVADDFMTLVRQNGEVDIIIDVTGVPSVRETLRKHMVDTGNSHTLIMHERIALLMMSLSAKQLVCGKHDRLEYL